MEGHQSTPLEETTFERSSAAIWLSKDKPMPDKPWKVKLRWVQRIVGRRDYSDDRSEIIWQKFRRRNYTILLGKIQRKQKITRLSANIWFPQIIFDYSNLIYD